MSIQDTPRLIDAFEAFVLCSRVPTSSIHHSRVSTSPTHRSRVSPSPIHSHHVSLLGTTGITLRYSPLHDQRERVSYSQLEASNSTPRPPALGTLLRIFSSSQALTPSSSLPLLLIYSGFDSPSFDRQLIHSLSAFKPLSRYSPEVRVPIFHSTWAARESRTTTASFDHTILQLLFFF